MWVQIEGKQDSVIAYVFQILKHSFGRVHSGWDLDETKVVQTNDVREILDLAIRE